MDLNLFENLKKDIESNVTIKNFMEEVSEFLKNITSSSSLKNVDSISSKRVIDSAATDTLMDVNENLDEELKENRKEGHLYFVTEDRSNEVYLWDFTDKPKHEFKEVIDSEELLSVAKEGAMLQYKDGRYELYSADGYDMVFDENNK